MLALVSLLATGLAAAKSVDSLKEIEQELPGRPSANFYISLDETKVVNNKLNYNSKAATATQKYFWQYYQVTVPDAVHATFQFDVVWNTAQWLKDGKAEGEGEMFIYVADEAFPAPTNWDWRALTPYQNGTATMRVITMNTKPGNFLNIAVGGTKGANYTITATNKNGFYSPPTTFKMDSIVDLAEVAEGTFELIPNQYKTYQVELPEACSKAAEGDNWEEELDRCYIGVQFYGTFKSLDGFRAYVNAGRHVPTRAKSQWSWAPYHTAGKDDYSGPIDEIDPRHAEINVVWQGLTLSNHDLHGAQYITIAVTAGVEMFTEGRTMPLMRVLSVGTSASENAPRAKSARNWFWAIRFNPNLNTHASFPVECKQECYTFAVDENSKQASNAFTPNFASEECRGCLHHHREATRHEAFGDFAEYENCWMECDDQCNDWCIADCYPDLTPEQQADLAIKGQDSGYVFNGCYETCTSRCTKFSHGCTMGCMIADNNPAFTQCFTQCDNSCYNLCEENHLEEEEKYRYSPTLAQWTHGVERSAFEQCVEECDEVCGFDCLFDELAIVAFNDPHMEHCFDDCKGFKKDTCYCSQYQGQDEDGIWIDKSHKYTYDNFGAADLECLAYTCYDDKMNPDTKAICEGTPFNPNCLEYCGSDEEAFTACFTNDDGTWDETNLDAYCVRFPDNEQCINSCAHPPPHSYCEMVSVQSFHYPVPSQNNFFIEQASCTLDCTSAAHGKDVDWLYKLCEHCEHVKEDHKPVTCLIDCLHPVWHGPAPDGGNLYHCARECEELPYGQQYTCVQDCYAQSDMATCLTGCGDSATDNEKRYCEEDCAGYYCTESCQLQMQQQKRDEIAHRAASFLRDDYSAGTDMQTYMQCEKTCRQEQNIIVKWESEEQQYEQELHHFEKEQQEKKEMEQQVQDNIARQEAAKEQYKENNKGGGKMNLKLTKSMFANVNLN